MKVDPKTLTVDAKTLMRLSVSDRNAMIRNDSFREAILNALTPYQIAMMFPTYYKQMVGISAGGGGGGGGGNIMKALSGMIPTEGISTFGTSAAPLRVPVPTTSAPVPTVSGPTQTYGWYKRFMALRQKEAESPGPGGLDTGHRPVSVTSGSSKNRVDIRYDGRTAPTRYNNPGGAYPRGDLEKFGLEGYGIIGGGHKIAKYPTVAHGMAANMEHFRLLNPVGMTVGQARYLWVHGSRSGSMSLPGLNANQVITQEMINDSAWMTQWMKATAQAEGYQGVLSPTEMNRAWQYYKNPGSVTSTSTPIPIPEQRPQQQITPNQTAYKPASTEKGTMLFLHGKQSRYQGKKPEQVEAEARRYAAAKGLKFEAINVSGDLTQQQIQAAIARVNQGGVSHMLGFSAGGYNMKHIISGLSDDVKKQLQGVTIIGAPNTGKIPDVPTELYADPKTGHMDAVNWLAQQAETLQGTRRTTPASYEQEAGIPQQLPFAMDTKTLNDLNLKRPGHMKGTVTFEDDPEYMAQFGSGGARDSAGSVPFGRYEIMPGLKQQSKYKSFVNNSFYVKDMFDPQVGRMRTGILFHQASDWQNMYTHGCLGIRPDQWPGFKAKMLEFQKNSGGGPVYADITPNGVRITSAKTPGINYETVTQVVKDRPDLPSGANPGLAAANLSRLPAGLPEGLIKEFSTLNAAQQEELISQFNAMGPEGVKTITDFYNEDITSRAAVKSEKIIEAVQNAPPGELPSLVSPVTGTIAGGGASVYGAHRHSRKGGHRPHSGIDWQAPDGSPVVAMTGGTVLYSGTNKGYGANIAIKGDDGVIRRYAAHGSVVDVKPGTRIQQGEQIGVIGEGHLHYEEIPRILNGEENPVYQEFISKPGEFVDTSFQRGTRDPLVSNNVAAGTKVKAGEAFGMPAVSPSVVPEMQSPLAPTDYPILPPSEATAVQTPTSAPEPSAMPSATPTAAMPYSFDIDAATRAIMENPDDPKWGLNWFQRTGIKAGKGSQEMYDRVQQGILDKFQEKGVQYNNGMITSPITQEQLDKYGGFLQQQVPNQPSEGIKIQNENPLMQPGMDLGPIEINQSAPDIQAQKEGGRTKKRLIHEDGFISDKYGNPLMQFTAGEKINTKESGQIDVTKKDMNVPPAPEKDYSPKVEVKTDSNREQNMQTQKSSSEMQGAKNEDIRQYTWHTPDNTPNPVNRTHNIGLDGRKPFGTLWNQT